MVNIAIVVEGLRVYGPNTLPMLENHMEKHMRNQMDPGAT